MLFDCGESHFNACAAYLTLRLCSGDEKKVDPREDLDFLPNKQGFANSIPIFIAGFQQFSEKQCGKASPYISNAARRARFGALHMIECGL